MKKVLFLFLLVINCVCFSEKRVYVDIVGDLFHAGHIDFIKEAKTYGDYLIVGIHSDEDVAKYKRVPILTLKERAKIIESCKYIDEVILYAPVGVTKELIEDNRIDLVIHGDDISQKSIEDQYSIPVEMGIFKTIPYTMGISTTDIINRIKSR